MNDIQNIDLFEYATRHKLRFPTEKGELNTEDLWDLSPETLDIMGIMIKEEIDGSYGKTLRNNYGDTHNHSMKCKTLPIKLGIIQHILNTKDKESARAQEQNRLNKQINELNLILNQKKSESLRNMSSEEIEKLIDKTRSELGNLD